MQTQTKVDNSVIAGHQFSQILKQHDPCIWRDHPLTVKGDIMIDGSWLKVKRLELSQITFTGYVHLKNFGGKDGGILILGDGCHFQRGIRLNKCVGEHLDVLNSTAKNIAITDCVFQSVTMTNVQVEEALDIGELEVQHVLTLFQVKFLNLELLCPGSRRSVLAGKVRTDDVTTATQFHLAGIPVFVTTEMARCYVPYP